MFAHFHFLQANLQLCLGSSLMTERRQKKENTDLKRRKKKITDLKRRKKKITDLKRRKKKEITTHSLWRQPGGTGMTRRWPSRGAVCHCGITLFGHGHELHIIILAVQDYLNSGWGGCREGGQNDVAFAVGGLAAVRHQGGDDHLDLDVLDVGWELVLDASQAADLCCRPAQKRDRVKDRLCLQLGENGGGMKRTRLLSCSCPSPPPPPPQTVTWSVHTHSGDKVLRFEETPKRYVTFQTWADWPTDGDFTMTKLMVTLSRQNWWRLYDDKTELMTVAVGLWPCDDKTKFMTVAVGWWVYDDKTELMTAVVGWYRNNDKTEGDFMMTKTEGDCGDKTEPITAVDGSWLYNEQS